MTEDSKQENIRAPKSHFSSSRTFIIARRVLRQLARDRRTFGMIIVMPLIIMFVFGLALTGSVSNIPVVIDNADVPYTHTNYLGQTVTLSLGDNFTRALQADDRLQVTLGNYADNKASVDSGGLFAVIRIPANFSEIMFNKTELRPPTIANLTIELYLDGTKLSIKASILGAVQDGLTSVLGNNTGLDIEQQFAFGGAEFSGFNQAIPAIMGFVLTMILLIISSLTLKRETIGGTEERLLTTPLKVSERLLGYTIALLLLSLIIIGMILLIGVVGFGAVIQGSWLLLIGLFLLFGLTNIFLAVFLANLARNEIQAVQAAVLIALPSMALSGLFTPVISFPVWVQVISHFIPLYYGVRLFEGVMLKGWDVVGIWPDLLALICFAVVFLVLALLTVKDKLDV